MKKIWASVFIVSFFSLLTCGMALSTPVPFQIVDSDLAVSWDWKFGSGNYNYTPNIMSDPIELDVGESFDFTFGTVSLSPVLGKGTAEFGVTFSSPNVVGDPGGTAKFIVASWGITAGALTFNAPETFSYSFSGSTGGLVTVAFDNLYGIQCGSCIDITGTITNTKNPDPVPEPATMLLFGAGIAGLIGSKARRKK